MKKILKLMMLLWCFLLVFVSCGKKNSGDLQPINENVSDPQETDSGMDGLYNAKFETLNPHINGTVPGSATFYFNGDRLLTFLRVFAGFPRAWHQQGVYLGKRCPTLLDDKNLDGFIDIQEAMNVVGKMIIPLDANLNSQYEGKNFYPRGDLSGSYHYERVSSYQRLLNDLMAQDIYPDDHIVKLNPDETFSLFGKVVLVQGINEDPLLPDTVGSLGDKKSFQTLPITCGIIKRVKAPPGSSQYDEIPGPVADVEEGQDRPSPEGPNIPRTTGGSDSGGPTSGGSTSGGSTSGGSTSGGSTSGGSTSGGSTSGGSTSGGSTSGGSTSGDSTSGGSTSGDSTSGGSTSGGSTSGDSTSGGSTSGGGEDGGTDPSETRPGHHKR